MNWISIALNVVSTHKHTHALVGSLRAMRISHLTSGTRTEFLRVTCGRPDIAPQEEGLCQRRRKRGIHEGERRRREEEEGEESQKAVGVEVIMRH